MRSPEWDAFTARVRESSDILRVVGAYVSLKQKGNNYWACCPFHNEKTPSFSVSPDKGLFYCFGCHAGGDVFKFISMIENVNYGEAIKLQAERLGIPLPSRKRDAKEIARDQKIADMQKVMAMARDFFHSCLVNTRYGVSGLKYLHGRGINDDTIKNFALGFAPNSFEKLKNAFMKRGISEQLLLDCGLIKRRQDGSGTYDTFRNRVMIPIADEMSRVVAFGGRVMDDALPKYLNSPETMIFNKRKMLFGLDRAKKAIGNEKYAILVEGYMDAISLSSAGVKNVVASLGTAFTVEHARKILRHAPEVCFCYDSDEAGQKATIRALSIIRATGAKVRVLVVPDGKDPDEFIRRHGADSFKELAKNALSVPDFEINYALSHNDIRTMDGKTNVLHAMIPVIAASNTIEKLDLIERLSRVLSIEDGIIKQELSHYRGADAGRYAESSVRKRKLVRSVDDAVMKAGRVVVRVAWDDVGTLAHISSLVPIDEFPVATHCEILKYIMACDEKGEKYDESSAMANLSEEAASELSRILTDDFAGELPRDIYDKCAKVIYLTYLKMLYEEHRIKADELEKQGKSDEALRELDESRQIFDKINRIKETRNG